MVATFNTVFKIPDGSMSHVYSTKANIVRTEIKIPARDVRLSRI